MNLKVNNLYIQDINEFNLYILEYIHSSMNDFSLVCN